jgi:hypothetical protein
VPSTQTARERGCDLARMLAFDFKPGVKEWWRRACTGQGRTGRAPQCLISEPTFGDSPQSEHSLRSTMFLRKSVDIAPADSSCCLTQAFSTLIHTYRVTARVMGHSRYLFCPKLYNRMVDKSIRVPAVTNDLSAPFERHSAVVVSDLSRPTSKTRAMVSGAIGATMGSDTTSRIVFGICVYLALEGCSPNRRDRGVRPIDPDWTELGLPYVPSKLWHNEGSSFVVMRRIMAAAGTITYLTNLPSIVGAFTV